uniref:transposase n=1 Tax=Limosilactobacillus reuteri TaxID=1598 RepID=UPI001CDA6F5B
MYRRRKFDVEPVFGHMKRDFGIRRTHLRGQRAVENDIGLALMALNLTKFGQSISRLETNFINHNHPSNGIFYHLLYDHHQ